ncbi:MAG: hypothetical protein Q9183_005742 [Haloplaca sp. 2 TL-2023]
MAQVPPFGVILPSRPVITNPTSISPSQYAFNLSIAPSFSHVVVFLVPGTPLPVDTLAAVYIQFPNTEFKLLGAIGDEKQTAIFRVRNSDGNSATGLSTTTAEEEMTDVQDTSQPTVDGQITIGISIEPTATIAAQLASLKDSSSSSTPQTSSALVIARPPSSQPSPVSTKVLAQRIIKNAFNFLASFAGQTTVGEEEMVPLRSFRGWWEKFERRVELDPGFLERESDA